MKTSEPVLFIELPNTTTCSPVQEIDLRFYYDEQMKVAD